LQKVLNDLKRNRLSSRRMIRLLPLFLPEKTKYFMGDYNSGEKEKM
jgi:hypothetical protein